MESTAGLIVAIICLLGVSITAGVLIVGLDELAKLIGRRYKR